MERGKSGHRVKVLSSRECHGSQRKRALGEMEFGGVVTPWPD